MAVKIGLERLLSDNFISFNGKRVGLLCNQASIDKNFKHAIEIFFQMHKRGVIKLNALFGPQHGIWGHTQDNMIEWKGGYKDKQTGVRIYSLYGEHRKPTSDMLQDLDVMVIDLQDVGARYYTFIWTMALCMEACSESGIEVIVLDRPNPIGGVEIEGTLIDSDFRSFVGLHSLPIRHGLTIGEIAKYFRDKYYPKCLLEIVEMAGWKREMYFDDCLLPWAIPSPNIPTEQSTIVYPGMCLLEATNISEGRGTTRPFENFGAPWMNSWEFSEKLNSLNLPGVYFRPFQFQPTFNKYQNELCEGCFIHVTNRDTFKPFLTGIAIIAETVKQYLDNFFWKDPPYEYEYEKMPFDILVGNSWTREMINAGRSVKEMAEKWEEELESFKQTRASYLMY